MTNGDEPMYPVLDASKTQAHGLTKREYFAAMAMHGMITANQMHFDNITGKSVKLADTLIAELNKPAT